MCFFLKGAFGNFKFEKKCSVKIIHVYRMNMFPTFLHSQRLETIIIVCYTPSFETIAAGLPTLGTTVLGFQPIRADNNRNMFKFWECILLVSLINGPPVLELVPFSVQNLVIVVNVGHTVLKEIIQKRLWSLAFMYLLVQLWIETFGCPN